MTVAGHAEDCDCEGCAPAAPPRKLRATVLGVARRCLLLSQVDDASELVQPAAMMGQLPPVGRTRPAGKRVRVEAKFTPKRARAK